MKNIHSIRFISLLICFYAFCLLGEEGKGIKRIVFDEFQIEGKIRRPQLVLIKAEQRPKFTPVVMQSLDSDINVMTFAVDSVVERSPYDGVFLFEGKEISNYKP